MAGVAARRLALAASRQLRVLRPPLAVVAILLLIQVAAKAMAMVATSMAAVKPRTATTVFLFFHMLRSKGRLQI